MSLTIALNRGRILKECLPLFAAAGFAPAEDMDKSRKLVFETKTGSHRLLVVRGSDVPTYVEYGAADVGITGKDTLLEHHSTAGYYERLDLNIGVCRLMTAAPESQARQLAATGGESLAPLFLSPAGKDGVGTAPATWAARGGKLRVATKFVRSTEKYFAERRQPVSIIKLAGAMEIAPAMGLADCIVDIVDTGNTLRANGLVPLDTIADISTRLIVNRASMKTKQREIDTLITTLRPLVQAA
ncbi:MAG: ATP phosphoribosyltransferase [Pseudomonadota bacterium]